MGAPGPAEVRHWLVVPAAGTGRRVGSDVPKQYLPLAGRSLIEWAIAPFLGREDLLGICIAVAPADPHWRRLAISEDPRVRVCAGGEERCDSVLAALDRLAAEAHAEDWVLVHDAARPCLARSDVDSLLREVSLDPVGGLLATPLADTLKRSGPDRHSESTVDRAGLWRALTPQMFRYGLLRDALERARGDGARVTDEAAAIERLNLRPLLVEGRPDNLKVTTGRDLELAAAILAARQLGAS
ncbi:MAG TPA: 2-C-methyl-D-erythritol 4-phosphate cytidylyltransferase [Steroidobacteraceae bacterium]|nr:2-C-methyl-D-erythritol 4-phosphate cytidylyltransferase [Steroidobacteraceae bacterium]